MAKKRQRKSKHELIEQSSFDLEKIVPAKYQTAAALAIILIVFLIYLSPIYFGGKTFESGDIITSKASSSYVEKEREGYTLWNPYIFCGMPAYAIALEYKWFNAVYVAVRSVRDLFSTVFSVDYAQWTFYLLALAFSSFLLIRHLSRDPLISLFGALATSLSSGIMLFLMIGHVTKLITLGFYPLIFLMLLRFQERIKFRDFAILIIVLQVSIQGFHVQIIFYTLFAIGIYFLFNFVRIFIAKQSVELKKYFKSGLTFAAAFIIAMLIQADNLTQIYEYNPYSTRGTESILDSAGDKDAGKAESEFYQYATNWSFSPGEMLTFIIPSFYGFGTSTYSGPLTQGREVEVNTYFGQMLSVDLPMYMGVIVLFLAIFSVYANWRNPFVKYITILIFISLLISFGRTFPPFYDLMFNYFPYFDKFRVPSMILVLVQLSVPVLAALGLHKIVTENDETKISFDNFFLKSAFIITGLCFVAIVLNGVLSEWFSGRVGEHVKILQSGNPRLAQQFTALKGYMSDMFSSDVIFTFGFLSAASWVIVAYHKAKINISILLIIIIVLTAVDLIRVNKRGETYSDAKISEKLFSEPEYISIIKSQGEQEPYRILNIKQDGSYGAINRNSNFNSFFLEQDFHGYSAIKPRAYQDFMDVLGPGNPSLWNMLNVKYIIGDRAINIPALSLIKQADNSFIYKNLNAEPRFYFVDCVSVLPELDAIRAIGKPEFNPEEIAYVKKEIIVDKTDSTAYVQLKSYADEKIELTVNASGNNLLFWGDTHYPVGWHAYIDENETEIIKVNHGFNGVVVPEGNHEIKIIYLPESFTITKYLVLVLSTLVFLLLCINIGKEWKGLKTFQK